MALLSLDDSRCAGRFDMLAETPPCERRGNCARYTEIFKDMERGLNGHTKVIMHCYKDDTPTLFIDENLHQMP